MSEYIFLDVTRELEDRLPLDALPFPVRRERETAVRPGGRPQADLLLDELAAYLVEHPRHTDRYRDSGGKLSYRVALEMATEGYTEMSLRYFELGLFLRPDDLDMRTNYAVALHALDRIEESLAQYEKVLPASDIGRRSHLWVLAARLFARLGKWARAHELLDRCVPLFPRDESFWDFLSEVEERLGISPPEIAPGPSEEAGRATAPACGHCGTSLPGPARFCPQCGKPAVTPPAPATAASCPRCGRPRKRDAQFCGGCGTKLNA